MSCFEMSKIYAATRLKVGFDDLAVQLCSELSAAAIKDGRKKAGLCASPSIHVGSRIRFERRPMRCSMSNIFHQG